MLNKPEVFLPLMCSSVVGTSKPMPLSWYVSDIVESLLARVRAICVAWEYLKALLNSSQTMR